jgi:electron transport complex protein RnfE
VSNSLINGLGLGLATLFILVITSVLVWSFHASLQAEIRLPLLVLMIACSVTITELLMHAYWPALYKALGVFVPLIVTNCAIMAHAQRSATRSASRDVVAEGFWLGVGFLLVLVLLGAVRELIGHGTLLANAERLFGPTAQSWVIRPFNDYPGLLLAALPPGAFMLLGLLIALKNAVSTRQTASQTAPNTTDTISDMVTNV